MFNSISASKAKATHDAAMNIIEAEAKLRAVKTERLRQLRLAHEAQANAVDRVTVPKSRPRKAGR